MMTSPESLRLNFSHLSTEHSKINSAVVIVPAYLVNKVYKHALMAQKNEASTYGFHKGTVPMGYIEKNFRNNVIDHLKEFLFRYFVVSFLYKELKRNKIVFVGDPRLTAVNVDPAKDAEFHFEFTPADHIELEDWKYIVFKAPKRKNYKDLDKQATAFIKEELAKKESYTNKSLDIGDWICFDISIVEGPNNDKILGELKETLWLKLGDDEPSLPFQEIFINKKIGDVFYTDENCFQVYFDSEINSKYLFCIEVKDILYKNFFSIDYLKEHFKLKANKSIHQKMIEVFSFRNDLSLRRVIIEELFDLFFSKFNFTAPNSAVLRQQELVLNILQTIPDYPVYKMQKDFDRRVRLLAEKQVKETILIDHLTYREDISSTHDDIKYYLNLSNRARTKELLYFQHPIIKANEQEYPVPAELLAQSCLREKTLNHVIFHLTKDY